MAEPFRQDRTTPRLCLPGSRSPLCPPRPPDSGPLAPPEELGPAPVRALSSGTSRRGNIGRRLWPSGPATPLVGCAPPRSSSRPERAARERPPRLLYHSPCSSCAHLASAVKEHISRLVLSTHPDYLGALEKVRRFVR